MERQNRKFFLVVPVNMEKLALYELCRALPDEALDYTLHPGGVEVLLPLSVGLKLNCILKIPVRILLRVIEKETATEKQFVDLIHEANLKSFAPLGTVHVSSRSSYLRYKKSLEKTVYDSVGFSPKASATDIYIRFFRDVCTVSVNTSGEDLFHRGYEKWVGDAPVRDNIAAGLMQLLLKGTDDQTPIEIIDPMAGSGTFLLETYLKNTMARRAFAFESWQGAELTKRPDSVQTPVWSFYAYDQSAKNVEMIKHNSQIVGAPIISAQEDLFRSKKKLKGVMPRIVVCNPPYGKRLKTSGEKSYFQDILNRIVEVYQPDRIGILTLRDWLQLDNYEKIYELEMENSGIETLFSIFYKSDLK